MSSVFRKFGVNSQQQLTVLLRTQSTQLQVTETRLDLADDFTTEIKT